LTSKDSEGEQTRNIVFNRPSLILIDISPNSNGYYPYTPMVLIDQW
jgi:hypothetical protein